MLLGLALVGGACRGPEALPAPPPPAVRSDAPPPASTPVAAARALDDACLVVQPGPGPLRLLSRAEYDATLRDLLGDETSPAQRLPAEASLTGFQTDRAAHRATPLLVDGLLGLAEDVAGRALDERRHLVLPCDPAVVGEEACGRMLVRVFGARAFRRPLLDEDAAPYDALFEAARSAWGFDEAARLTVAAMLQSPRFLYVVELPSPGAAGPRADPWAVASRLSYLLWSSMPDDELFAAAAAGALATRADVEAQARRMLADPRAKRGLRAFLRQWLDLDAIDGIEKDAAAYPGFSPAFRASLRASIEAFVDGVLWSGTGTLEELFTSPVVHVDPLLSSFYALPGPDHGDGLVARDAPARAGLLTQPALLALLAGADQSSPIRRGVFVREKILCQPVPPPPPGVAANPPDPDPSATTRQRFAAHTADPFCASCHELIDPLGFGFERYDALGALRETENGLPVDDSGAVLGVDEPALQGSFSGALELSARLARSATVRGCVARQAFRFAAGRMEQHGDRCTLAGLEAALAASGGDLRELFVALAASDAFRAASTREAP